MHLSELHRIDLGRILRNHIDDGSLRLLAEAILCWSASQCSRNCLLEVLKETKHPDLLHFSSNSASGKLRLSLGPSGAACIAGPFKFNRIFVRRVLYYIVLAYGREIRPRNPEFTKISIHAELPTGLKVLCTRFANERGHVAFFSKVIYCSECRGSEDTHQSMSCLDTFV